MNIIWKDRVRQVVITGGSGDIVLGAADATCQALDANDQGGVIFYLIMNKDGSWETGSGTYTHATATFTRDTIYDSTDNGAAIDVIAPTAKFVLTQNSGSFRHYQDPSVKSYNILSSNTAPFIADSTLDNATKWIVTVETSDQTETRMFDVSALKRNTTTRHNISSDLGDRINVSVDVTLYGAELALMLVNNSSKDVTISVARIKVVA